MAVKNGKVQARRVSESSLPGWAWLIIGMVLGVVLFLALSAVLKRDGNDIPNFGSRRNANTVRPPSAIAPVDSIDTELTDISPPSAPMDGAVETPHYDFFEYLARGEVRMSDDELVAREREEEAHRARAALTQTPQTQALPAPLTETAAPATVAAAPAGRYLLQAGSFSSVEDAESRKAKLALVGLSARVESAQVEGRTVYRVRMGPYATAGELSEVKQKLNNEGVQPLAIRTE